MTMHVVYLKGHDGHEAGQDYFVERTLGRRLCENGVTEPYTTYVARKKAEAEAAEKAAEDAKLKKRAAAEKSKQDRKPPKRKFKRPEKAVEIE